MNQAQSTISTIAGWIPSRIRGIIYALIGLFWLIEGIWNVIPDNAVGSKIAATITLLGMIMAVGNTELVTAPINPPADGDPPPDAGESTLMTIVLVLIIILVVAFLFGWVRP